jgi:endoglycosylceramidase
MKNIALAALLLLACGDDDDDGAAPADAGLDAAPPPPTFSPLDSDGRHFRDPQGRAVILRGINARVEGVFDVTFRDFMPDREPLEPIPALTPADCVRMYELGFSVLRLPINWSGIEPQRDQIDEAYLEAVDAAVDCAADAGVLVLVDFHQDAYSKEIGEDGAPYWAIVPEPTEWLEGPLDNLDERRLSQQVQDAFSSFFEIGDPHGLQAEMIDVIGLVAARYKDHPGVVGIELYNEPLGLEDELLAFHTAAARRVREVAPEKLVFFEPSAIRNFLDSAPEADAPFPVSGAIYAPHVYTLAFADPNNELATVTKERLRDSNVDARFEADSWGAPLFIGEFGAGPSVTNYDAYLTLQYDLQDEVFASSAMWLWKEDSQGSWGLFESTGDDTWEERPGMINVVSRPYAHRVAGTPTEMTWDREAGTFTVAYEDAVDAPSVLYVPERFTASGATCDGAAATLAGSARWVEVSCGGAGAHEIVLSLDAL